MAKFSLKGVFVPVTFSLISLVVALAAIVLAVIAIKKREKKRVMIISGAVLGLAAIVVVAMRVIPILMSYYEKGWAVY